MIVCDLCGEAKDCTAREIEGKEYDICSECWEQIATKLRGKGRVQKERETVFLPSTTKQPEPPEPQPSPGEPPKIWGRTDLTQ
jgi:ribosome-binding protein aMBF1 (putative translation factor)